MGLKRGLVRAPQRGLVRAPQRGLLRAPPGGLQRQDSRINLVREITFLLDDSSLPVELKLDLIAGARRGYPRPLDPLLAVPGTDISFEGRIRIW